VKGGRESCRIETDVVVETRILKASIIIGWRRGGQLANGGDDQLGGERAAVVRQADG